MDYYLILDGTVYGPYTLEEMKSLQLFHNTPVHLSSWPDDKWVYASDLLELRDCINDSQAAWRPNMTTPAADWIPAAYYLMLEGAVYGPYALSEMKSLQLFPDTPVHHSSWPDNKWVYASELPELRDCISVSYADAGRQETPSPDANAGDFVQPQPQPQPQPRPQPGQDNTNPGNENRPEKSGISPAWIILPAAAVLVIIAAAVIIYFSGSGGYDAGDVESKENSAYKESRTRTVTNVSKQTVQQCNSGSKRLCKDGKSGLMWSAKSSTMLNWSDAMDYCNNLNEGGFSDWRLPTIDELRTLVKNCSKTEPRGECRVSEKNGRIYENDMQQASCSCETRKNNAGYYSIVGDDDRVTLWSSSTTSKIAWAIGFANALVAYGHKHDKNGRQPYVRCVR